VKRGEIYVVDLGPGVGREASGVRPVVVLSFTFPQYLPLTVVIVPTVDAADVTAVIGVPLASSESGLPNDVAVLAKQPRTLDPSRFPEQPCGRVPDDVMTRIDKALRLELDL
jgi:mRNA interferase MazF